MFSVAAESSASSPNRSEPSRPSRPDARSEPNGFAALVDAKVHTAESPRTATADRREPSRTPRSASPPASDSREAAADANTAPSDRSRRGERTVRDNHSRHQADEPSKPAKAAQDPDDASAGHPKQTSETDTAEESATATPPAVAATAIVAAVAGAAGEVDATNFTIAKTIATTPVPTAALPSNADAQPATATRLAAAVGATAIKAIKAGDTPPVTPADPAPPDGAPRSPSPSAAQPHPAGNAGGTDATPTLLASAADHANGDAARAPAGEHHAATMAPQPTTPDAMSQLGASLATPQAPTATASPAAQPTATAAASLAVPIGGLAVEIAANARAGNSRFDIRLDPAELGRIDVRLDVDRHGQVTSHLTVEKPETLAMLRQDAAQLQRALEDAGLKTGQDSLQFSLRNQYSGDQSSGNQNHGDAERRPQRLVIGDGGATPQAAANTTYIHAVGASRGLDIRV